MTTTDKVAQYLKTCDLSRVREPDVTAYLGLSKCVARRRLASEGSGYNVLLANERKRRARELLARNHHADMWGIARASGLKHPGSVSKAFFQWFGCTLREYKAIPAIEDK